MYELTVLDFLFLIIVIIIVFFLCQSSQKDQMQLAGIWKMGDVQAGSLCILAVVPLVSKFTSLIEARDVG